MARRYGGNDAGEPPWRALATSPPLWAALVALALNAGGTPLPIWLGLLLDRLAAGVAPLMLLVIGLSLVFTRRLKSQLPSLLPVVVIQLVLMPVLIWGLAIALGISGEWRTAKASPSPTSTSVTAITETRTMSSDRVERHNAPSTSAGNNKLYTTAANVRRTTPGSRPNGE